MAAVPENLMLPVGDRHTEAHGPSGKLMSHSITSTLPNTAWTVTHRPTEAPGVGAASCRLVRKWQSPPSPSRSSGPVMSTTLPDANKCHGWSQLGEERVCNQDANWQLDTGNTTRLD